MQTYDHPDTEDQSAASGAKPREIPGMSFVPGRTFRMGSDAHYPEEAPAHDVTVTGFWIDRHLVTNREFRQFVEETGHVTSAEKPARAEDYPGAKPEMLAPSSVVFQQPRGIIDVRNHYNWWAYVPGASWRHPQGPSSSLKGLADHPVVHVAYEDALAYATWAKKELPTEAEWELAARGALENMEYAWGSELSPGGRIMANTWQGEFPHKRRKHKKYEWTSPVGSFPANGYGLFDMIGNVWEWTSDYYQPHHAKPQGCCGQIDPRGADREASIDPRSPGVSIPTKVMKGGSYLCAPNYCRRYRPAARMAQPMDTSTSHLGFRCVVRRAVVPQPASAI